MSESKIFRRVILFLFLLLILTGGTARGKVITIMTANLPCGGWPNEYYYPQSLRIFQGLKPDIAFIQEFNVKEPLTRREYIDDALGEDYFMYTGSGEIPNTIASRWSFQTWGEWPDSEVAGSRTFVWAVIDIPGPIDLQGVCVHLKASPGPDNRSKRFREAVQIRDRVRRNFNNTGYIVVAGDLNTYPSPSEPCLNIFRSYLSVNYHRPRDRRGRYFTNATNPRRYHYDWIMPNRRLDRCHTTVYVGTKNRPYRQGIVFDSKIFRDVSEVSPIRENDSHPYGVHHMAVMKAFDIPLSPTPSPAASITPQSSPTPAPKKQK